MNDQRHDRPAPWFAVVGGGVGTGLIAGLFGVGGGLLFVSALVFLSRLGQHEAHATSLVAVTLTAVAAAGRFASSASVAWEGAVALSLGAVVGAELGTRLLPRIGERVLLLAFAALLGGIGLRLVIAGAGGSAAGQHLPKLSPALVGLHVAGGLGAGMVSSVFGVGGGIVYVPLLVLGFGYGQHIAEGTSLAVIVPTALAGAVGHHRHDYTRWVTGLRLGAGGVAGGVAGAHAALSLPSDVLARLFGALLLVLAVLFLQRGATEAEGQDRRPTVD